MIFSDRIDFRHVFIGRGDISAARRANRLGPIGIRAVARSRLRDHRQGSRVGPAMQLDRIHCRKLRHRERLHIAIHAAHVHRRHRLRVLNYFQRVGLAAALQVGINQKVHGVELMTFAALMHRRGLASCRDRSQV